MLTADCELAMLSLTTILGTFALAYLLGSIPFGLILTRLCGVGDVRHIGSGNIGATNVARTGHKKLAALTLFLDAGKGFLAVVLARFAYDGNVASLAGLFVVLGHVFPVWLHFKGGKGVATTVGVFFALNWILGAAVCLLWLVAFYFLRISSVAAMLSIAYSAVAAYLLTNDATALLCLILAVLIVFTHRDNLRRLLEGNEYNFSI